jgi:hypothetical protein
MGKQVLDNSNKKHISSPTLASAIQAGEQCSNYYDRNPGCGGFKNEPAIEVRNFWCGCDTSAVSRTLSVIAA